MKHLFRMIFVVLLGSAMSVGAQWKDRDGNPIANIDRIKTDESFSAQLVLVPDPEQFRKTFEKSPKAEVFDSSRTFRRGAKLGAVVLFQNCSIGSTGVCDGLVRFSLVGPDGKEKPLSKGILWTKRSVPNRPLLADSVLSHALSEASQIGTNTVMATVIDRVTNQQLKLKVDFNLL